MEKHHKEYILKKIRKKIRPNYKRIQFISRIAVSITFIALLSVTVWSLSEINKQDKNDLFIAEVPSGNKAKLTLPDNSSVKLNSESSLSYTVLEGKRVAVLKGEAFFQIAENVKYPFVVQIKDLSIEVTGTSFNVYTDDDSGLIETSLLEGSVKLYDSKSTSGIVELKPNQKAIYYPESRKLRIRNTDNVKETAWVYDNLIFESETFISVLHKIERWYGVKIQLLCKEIADDRISGSFKNEQLPYVMEALKIQYGFKYEITGNQVIISK